MSSNTGYTQNFQTQIAKTKTSKLKRSFKHLIRNSADFGNDLVNSEQDSKEAETNPLKDHLKFELLTGGKWVTLDSSSSQIEATNQPLRISYVPLKDPVKNSNVELTFQKCHSEFKIKKEKAILTFKLTPFSPQKKRNKLGGRSSEVISRLPAGMYSIDITTNDSKKIIDFWLKVSAASPEPPIISSIDTRLAEQGELSLKLKNVIAGDQISLFVNGEPTKPVIIRKESKLDSYFLFGPILPPGTSLITVKVKRHDKESDYSSAVKTTARSTVIMARNTELIEENFKNRSRNSQDDPRLEDDSEFEFVNSRYSKKKKKRKYVTKDELKEELAEQLEKLNDSIKGEIAQAHQAQALSAYEKQIDSLSTLVEKITKELTKQQQADQALQNQINGKFADLNREIQSLKKCMKYLRTGWGNEAVFSWPSPEAVRESYLKNIKQLETLPFLTHRVLIEKEYSDKILDACKKSGEFTLDITFKTMDPQQATSELMRIVSFSQDPNLRNFTLGQYKDELVFRIRTDAGNALDQNGLSKTNGGSQGVHFKKGIKANEIHNVVISFYDQTLHFWLDGKKLPLTEKYAAPISGWDKSYRLLLGDELVVTDGKRKWDGEVHSFSIRNRGVHLARPDADVFECLFSGSTPNANHTVSINDSLTTQSPDTFTASPTTAMNTDPTSESRSPDTSTSSSDSDSDSDTDTDSIDLETSESKKIAVKEFAFPFPASFPLPRYHRDGSSFETEGAVLDQMRLAITKDGRYQLDFETRSTVRAEITLQLLVQLDNGQWYPLTIPKQTIVPSEYKQDQSESAKYAESKSIKGYAPILVNRSGQIRDIRRRGNAVFGTPPYNN
ncbi:coiled-coil domain-containing protein [Gimesia alba]|nr:hypothetical protein [Gimesia alba]